MEEVKRKRSRPRKKPVEKLEEVEAEQVSTDKKKGVGKNGNLIPFNQMSKEEQREKSRKGGIASGESKRRKKELREFTKDFLMQDAAPVLKQNMSVLGVDQEQMTNIAAMVIRLFSKAVNNGDLNAARTIIEWAGMAPLQQERENEAIARMAQVMQLAGHEEKDEDEDDVIFYIPDNGRPIIREEDLVTVE